MGIYDVNYDGLGIMTDEVKKEMQVKNNDIKNIGFKEWFYKKVTQPIKRKLRHNWLFQDLINIKKYIKWKKYYKNYE